MNVIFGSGVIGLLAKHILGPEWKIEPFYKSRFFSFNPSLCDNFIIRDDGLDDFIRDLTHKNCAVFVYKRAWSAAGQLVPQYDKLLCQSWLAKIFGANVPPQSESYYMNRLHLSVYDIRVNQLYQQLLDMYKTEILPNTKGEVTKIGRNYYIKDGVRHEFDHAISTIPLDALCKLMGGQVNLEAKTLHYLHVETSDLDFEGCNQLLVVDEYFPFYKAINVADNRYILYCHQDVDNPGALLMSMMRRFEIIDGTSITNALPVGPIPKIDLLENNGIYCVGSCAQWDWCMDIGSCILRLLKYANKTKPKEIIIK